jgi:endonuclease/exonuclease/phosphatase family metal-dependent hydrolase
LPTYPAWQPQRAIDHILVSEKLTAGAAQVLDVSYSDHCPVAVDIDLPTGFQLIEPQKPVLSVEVGRAP